MIEKNYEKPTHKADMRELYRLIAPILESGQDVKVAVSGFSMYPLLSSRRDYVLLTKPKQVRVGDVPLYIRADGSFILHRIVSEKNGSFATCGDYETKAEYPVHPQQIVAVAKGFWRKGKFIDVNDKAYCVYVALWRRMVPVRGPFLWFYHKLTAIYGGAKHRFSAKK